MDATAVYMLWIGAIDHDFRIVLYIIDNGKKGSKLGTFNYIFICRTIHTVWVTEYIFRIFYTFTSVSVSEYLIWCFFMLSFLSVLYFYLWFCVVNLFQIIFVVNSDGHGHRGNYRDNLLKALKTQVTNKLRTVSKIRGKVKFSLPPQYMRKLKPSTKTENSRTKLTETNSQWVNKSLRQRNDYINMQTGYFNQSRFNISHGQHNLRFWMKRSLHY